MRPSDKVIPLLVTLALVILAFFFMVNEYESRIQLLEGALNETRDSLWPQIHVQLHLRDGLPGQ